MQRDHLRLVTGLVLLGMFVSLWAAVGTPVVSAQGTLNPELIYTQRTEVLFPSAIRFVVGVNVPVSRIDVATLTVSQENGLELTFPLDLQRDLFADQGTAVELEYTWELTGETLPAPFMPVSFLWHIETTTAQFAEFEGQVRFIDTARPGWQQTGETPLILHWFNTNLAARSIRREIMSVYDLLVQNTGLQPSFEFAIYDPNTHLCQTTESGEQQSVVISLQDGSQYPCSEARYKNLYASAGMNFLKRRRFGYAEVQDALITEMVQDTYGTLWRGVFIPAWFRQGLAGLYHLSPNVAAVQITRRAARTEALISLDRLAVVPSNDLDFLDVYLWEAESYLLVLYLADRYGADAPFTLAREIPQHPGGFAGALQDLTGGDENLLWDEWYRWVFSYGADDAVYWSPYLATTPTPSPTPTITQIYVTRTPTITPSPTLTLAPTGTPEPSPTATPRVVTLAPAPTTIPTDNTTAGSADEDGGTFSAEMVMALVLVGIVGFLLLIVIGSALFRRRS